MRRALPPPSLHPQFLPAGAQFARAAFELSRGTCVWSRATNAEIFFQDGAGVTQEAEKRGNAVRGSLFVVAFVAGVLPFIVKARCLILQPA